ncbi:MAG: glutathione S-transferase N-terminal domain-containing protein [Myxococcales bacterium]|nr:glutathione S-transferase N-terminal domain-containing protein [Myxococcota bacterium]MDW8280145.1 glutathione S-transferase N-terminal domain-containing protein [Myxococcales bacterium]
MLLYGHDTSPYVRRVRVLLRELGVPFERDTDSWASPRLAAVNPLLRVPVLHDTARGQWLLDSRLIAAYLYDHLPGPAPAGATPPIQPTLFRPAHRWDDENLLLAIDAATDSAINVFLLERDGVPAASSPYLQRQQERVRSCLLHVEQRYAGRTTLGEGFLSFVDIALCCALDWLRFRRRYPVEDHPGLMHVLQAHASRPSLAETHPERAAHTAPPTVQRP